MTRREFRPLIALTTTTAEVGGRMRVRVNKPYTDALRRAGAIPVAVPPLDPGDARSLLDRVDGLLLTGGEDVDARRYGQAPHPSAEAPNPERDRWEEALVRAAREHRTPTLATCRGMQLANVAFGGTLVQDIASERPGSHTHTREDARGARVHTVRVETGTRLAGLLEPPSLTVNSLHHQAVDRPGAGLRIVARADDGIVEGIEWADDDWWMVGVQWHPEELEGSPEPWDRMLFDRFVAAVTASSASESRRAPGA